MTETKVDELDQIVLRGFYLLANKIILFNRKASGGVTALISKKVKSNVLT